MKEENEKTRTPINKKNQKDNEEEKKLGHPWNQGRKQGKGENQKEN